MIDDECAHRLNRLRSCLSFSGERVYALSTNAVRDTAACHLQMWARARAGAPPQLALLGYLRIVFGFGSAARTRIRLQSAIAKRV